MTRIDELYALRGYMPAPYGEKLLRWAAEVPDRLPIVEIGSYLGKSTCFLAEGAQTSGSRVWAIDAWDLNPADQAFMQKYKKPSTKATFHAQVAAMGHADHITVVHALSLDAVRDWTQPIGLLFIDGDHSYEGVRADYEAWGRFVVPGGRIVFDDWREVAEPEFEGVRRAIREVVDAGGWRSWEFTRFATALRD